MPGGTYNLCESNQNLGRTRCYVSLMQKLGGTHNLCEHRQSSAKVMGNVQPL
jgi:hypothetical protein